MTASTVILGWLAFIVLAIRWWAVIKRPEREKKR